MTDEEFERIKEAEKERLRSQKRLKEALSTLEKKRRIQAIVGRMSGEAKSVLRQSESILDSIRGAAARAEARFEVALESEDLDDETVVGEPASEEELEARAEALIRQLRLETRPGRERPGTVQERTIGRASASERTDVPASRTTSSQAQGDSSGSSAAPTLDGPSTLPEKTIGRMHRAGAGDGGDGLAESRKRSA